MAFDLAISENGDLIFAAAKDLMYIDGKALLEQRMMVRMVMARGAWILDRDSTLGSDLRYSLGHHPEKITDDVKAFVRTALEPMQDEIEIHAINVEQISENSLEVSVTYAVVIPNMPRSEMDLSTVLLRVPLGSLA